MQSSMTQTNGSPGFPGRFTVVMKQKSIGLVKGSIQDIPLDSVRRFSSRHIRKSSQEIEIRHALLPFDTPPKC